MRLISFLFLSTAIGLVAQIGPVVPGPASGIQVISGANQNAIAGTEFAQQMTIRVVDANGVGVPGVVVTYTFPNLNTIEATGIFVGGSLTQQITTNSAGFATSNYFSANILIGNYNVAITAPKGGGGTLTARIGQFNGPSTPYTTSVGSLSYSMVIGDQAPATQTVAVGSPTDGYDAATDSPWLKFGQRNNLLLDVFVDPTGLTPGRYFGYITINRQAVISVQFTIFSKPFLNATASRFTFTYTAGSALVPKTQFFSVGSSVRNLNLDANVKYNNPTKGNWLWVASARGMTTSSVLQAVADPRGMGPGTYTAEIDITAGDATNAPLVIPVTLVIARYPFFEPEISMVSNAATSEPGAIAAGELVRISGANFSCASGPSVMLDDDPMQIVSASDREIRVVVPDSAAQKFRPNLRVSCDNGTSSDYGVPVTYASPGIFTVDATQAVAYNEDHLQNGTAAPALHGSVITLYGTGLGKSDVAQVAVNIAGQAATLVGVSPADGMPGVSQIKVRVPAGSMTGPAAIQLLAGAESAQDGPAVILK